MSPWKAPSIEDRPILVFGGQVIGRRIACLWVAAGFNVNIQEKDPIERAEAMCYVIEHVNGYMRMIGRTKRGIITADESLSNTNSFNPWLAIETLTEIHPVLRQSNVRVDLVGYLNGTLPEDCLLCVNSTALAKKLLKTVNRPNRILNLHHYLIPNARVIEIVPNDFTEPAIVNFLWGPISQAGALPIIASSEASAMIFQHVWISFRHKALDALGKDTSSEAIDEVWEDILRTCSVEDLDNWFVTINQLFGILIVSTYMSANLDGGTVLSQLKDIFSSAAKVPHFDFYDGLIAGIQGEQLTAKLSTPLQRVGPDIYFADTGFDTPGACLALGRIVCSSTDGTVRVLAKDLNLPFGIDIHFATKTVYWSDLVDCNINACSLSGGSRRVVVPNDGLPAPEQIAIDQVASQMYWTQKDATQIRRSNLDGTSIEVVFDADVPSSLPGPKGWPNGFALDPSRRHIYWSRPQPDNEQKFRILRTSMDLPSGCTTGQRQDIEVVFDDLPEIGNIDFVPVFDELYWSTQGRSAMHAGSEIHRGIVNPCGCYGNENRKVVLRDLDEMRLLKVDPKAGHVYTTCLRGILARFDMSTWNNE